MWHTTKALITLYLVSFTQVQLALIHFKDCGSGEVESISIEPCKSLPCHFDQGSRANMTVTFVPKQSTTSAIIKSTLRYGGLIDYEIEIHDDDPYICKNGNSLRDWGKIDCPIEKDRRYVLVVSREFPVSSSYNIFRYSKLRFIAENGKMIACADMRLQFNRGDAPAQKVTIL